MANYADNLNDRSTGDGLTTGFTSRWATGGNWSVIDTGAGDHALRRLNSSSNARSFVSLDAINSDADRDDVDVLVRLRWGNNGTTTAGVVFRASGAAASETGYAAYITTGGDVRIARYVSGTLTTIAADTAANLAVDTFYWLRARIVGTAYEVTHWSGAEGDEPTSPQLTGTDSNISGVGWAGPFGFLGGFHLDWSDIAIATNGDVATMSPSTSWSVSLTEAATAADAVSETYSSAAALTESATAADTLAAATTWVLSLTESAAAADAATQSYSSSSASTLTETATLTDTVTAATTWVRTLTETAAPADVVTAVIQAVAALTESATLADGQATGSVYARDVSEAASPADALTAAATLVAQLAEAAAAGDTAAAATTWVRLLTEPATAADSVLGGAPGVAAVSITELAAAVDLIAAVLTGVDTPLDRPLFQRLAAATGRRLGASSVSAGERRVGSDTIDGPAAH